MNLNSSLNGQNLESDFKKERFKVHVCELKFESEYIWTVRGLFETEIKKKKC